MKTMQQRLAQATLPLVVLAALFTVTHGAHAQTDRLIIENGDNSLSKEQAREQKEQWDATHRLRGKVNNRVEKQFDKVDRAFDTQDSCEKSLNLNAYWEPNTLRCLDRRTGRPVTP
ncbi:DUF1283 family protein [Erwinia amylovora]|uniref:UPF0482 protein BN437_1796 n=4 Tax=Erwinia amylovora TaxID=552 RepID=A0A831ETC1_ERWAM|nr:DUF1283 family protein [Erwinia amylovora]CBX80616.1 Uncharacterized protein ynfB precursor [Erwinia amylovora ATCC BAA-2158]CCP03192.1 hypothetical protein BN439_2136 [Erwinia amylovora Ea644]CCP07194.1 hypothetical protein BN440_2171 [Erwinia amylovora MR1]CDK15235.1 putative protein ynfB precursor [Erwinia amylovora LA635]CDK18602.1 putative protein ynfB precursor [Erwinia amylovora LA636]CDK21971.1 putative protein ynfB precursor [Erwinia amylovora LA637]